MLKGKSLKLKIDAMSHGSAGIAHHDGLPIFVDNTCVGDEVSLEIYDDRKKFAFANLEELIEPSPLREANPPCKIHKICGGCQWQHIGYQEQLKFKRQNIIDLLVDQHIIDKAWRGNYELDMDFIPEAFAMEQPWHYRNRITYPVETVKSTGRLLAGYYKKKTHDLVNVKHCPIQYEIFDEIMETVKDVLTNHGIGKPLLRHIALRSNHQQNQVLLTFIVRKKELRESDKQTFETIAKEISQKYSAIKGVSLNYNDLSTNVIFGNETEVIHGAGYIIDEISGLQFRLSATSFFQVNNLQATKLVGTVKSFAAIQEGDKVLDAYAGTGALALALASERKTKLTAIEVIESSVLDGKENCRLNNLHNIEYLLGKVEDHIEEFKKDDFKVITVNPPRKGCTNKVLDALAQIAPERMVYVSCNPATLARDLKYLEQYGYKLAKLQPIDLFPHTYHIESVALIEKVKL